ncbi:MAG: membrane protein insertion efficiency factor YidD [bacterium]|nr:membrane protein insertion efficiency factor YidD [bacterium]
MASAQGSSPTGLGGSCQAVLRESHVRRTGTGPDPGASAGARELEPGVAAKAALALVAVYKRFLSPLLPRACRFSPSCSEYARLAILKYGFVGGSLRALGRLLRCHPFHPGGVDLP